MLIRGGELEGAELEGESAAMFCHKEREGFSQARCAALRCNSSEKVAAS
jgi:hypothetical protein